MTHDLFNDFPTNLPDNFLTTLLNAANIRIERIVSHGHVSPEGFWYNQDEQTGSLFCRMKRGFNSRREQYCGNLSSAIL